MGTLGAYLRRRPHVFLVDFEVIEVESKTASQVGNRLMLVGLTLTSPVVQWAPLHSTSDQ